MNDFEKKSTLKVNKLEGKELEDLTKGFEIPEDSDIKEESLEPVHDLMILFNNVEDVDKKLRMLKKSDTELSSKRLEDFEINYEGLKLFYREMEEARKTYVLFQENTEIQSDVESTKVFFEMISKGNKFLEQATFFSKEYRDIIVELKEIKSENLEEVTE